MIVATFPAGRVAAAGDVAATRRIDGVAVPYGVAGRVASGDLVVFEPGSLDAAARPPVLRDHDRARPIGRVVDARDTGTTLEASAHVSSTRDGDEALVLAADGVLAQFSVGVDPTDWRYDADGVLHVAAGDWQELSLLTVGAYPAAQVRTVTAAPPPTQETPDMTMTDPDPTRADPDVDDDDDQADDDDDGGDGGDAPDPVETGAVTVPVTAGRGSSLRRRGGSGPYADVTLRRLARIVNASRTDPRAARTAATILAAQRPASIEAALADITLVGTDNVGAAHRPAYQAELVEIIGWGTPTIDALRQGDLERGDYPNKTFNRWIKTPEVAVQAAEKDEIHSVAVSIGPASAPVVTFAGGNDISQQTVDLGSPSFVEDYIRAAAVDYAQQADTYAVNALLAAAADVATLAADTFIGIVGKLVGALSPATTPPGGLFLAMSYDVGVGLIGVPRDEGPAFWDGNVSFGTFTPTVNAGGLSAFVDPNLPARTYLLGHRNGATWYDLPGTPFNLRAVNVAQLGLDVAVYGYGALGIQYPGAFTKTTQPLVAG